MPVPTASCFNSKNDQAAATWIQCGTCVGTGATHVVCAGCWRRGATSDWQITHIGNGASGWAGGVTAPSWVEAGGVAVGQVCWRGMPQAVWFVHGDGDFASRPKGKCEAQVPSKRGKGEAKSSCPQGWRSPTTSQGRGSRVFFFFFRFFFLGGRGALNLRPCSLQESYWGRWWQGCF